MAPTVQQDTFIDDSDDCCPLCVEEFDLSDKHFKPCPCGYQICQFCYNNIRKNLNGLCPACRREYTDATMEFKQVSQEEYRAEQQKQSRKKQEQKQKELQKRELEQTTRKHLSGLRVVQKNLVYVTGLNPRIKEEDLLQTLRGDQFFGQYGRIHKIVVNKRTADKAPTERSAGMGVYVTFTRKEDAEKCIAAVDGSQNGERILRATYGTTKYCSAYLRNEHCPNKNCMFLHEQGEEVDSFTRQDLSSFNAQSSQRAGPSSQSSQSTQSSAPPPQPHPPIAAAAPPAQSTPTLPVRVPTYQNHPSIKPSRSPAIQDHGSPPSESSALPSSASWAARSTGTPVNNQSSNASEEKPTKGTILRTHPPEKRQTPEPRRVAKESVKERPASRVSAVGTTSLDGGAESSDTAARSTKNKAETTESKPPQSRAASPPPNPPAPSTVPPTPPANPVEIMLSDCVRRITASSFRFCFDKSMLSEEDYEEIQQMPPLIDKYGGAKRRERLVKEREREIEEERIRSQAQIQQVQHVSPLPMHQQIPVPQQQQQQPLPPISQQVQSRQATNQMFNVQTPQSQIQGPRTQTPGSALSQQHQNILSASQGLMQQTQLSQTLPQHHTQQHTRSSSRYNFDGIKAPPQQINHQQLLQQQQHLPGQGLLSNQIYGLNSSNANVQGPPPGLKSAQTPPNLMLYGQPVFGLGGAGMGSSNQQIGHMPGHAKSESQDLMQMMRSGAGKLEPVDEIIPSAEEFETIDRLVEDNTEFVPATPPPLPVTSISSAPPPVRPQDVPVLPATPLLNYATVGRTKSPLPKAVTPVTPKVQPAVAEPKSKKKKDEKPQAQPTMAAVAKAPPPPPTPSKTAQKEPTGKKAKPPTLPPLAAVVAAATAEHSPTSARSPAAASPKVLKLAAINQSSDAGPPSATSSVPPTPQLSTAAPVQTSRARTMRIVSSTSIENKAKGEGKDKDTKLHDAPPIANTTTRQGTRPATPASELISDTASTTSSKRGSISSPMVRSDSISSSTLAIAGKAKSKSALKKERQALAKKEEKEREREKDNAPIPSPTVEDHAPVVARARKKEKKSKAAAAGKTVKTTALPTSPGVATPTSMSPAAAVAVAAAESEHRDDRSSRAGSVSVAAPSEVHHEQTGIETSNNEAGNEPNKPDLSSTINANDIITALNESQEIDFMDLELLKPVVGLQHRFEISAAEIAEFGKRLSMVVAASAGDVGDHQISVEITTNPAVIASAASNPQSNSNTSATTRLIVTPGGVMLKGLSAEQEAKFIKLEERASKTPTPFKSSDLTKATFPVAKKELATTLAETLASKAAGLADLSLEDTLAYLNQLNQFLEFSPETAAAAAAAASQFAQAHTQFSAGRFQPAPIQQSPIPPKATLNPVTPSAKKPGKTPPATAAGPPPAPINPASVASAAVAAAAGSLEQMLMVGFQSAFNSKPLTESSMTTEEAEKMLVMSRKETEVYEKKLNNLVKRNKRLIFGALGLQV
ncbi:transcriptional repressor general negative regulator of transcription subunit 4 [Orbilia blumenaviensis]|uniref:Transcriptional repressor general negative regulator of transcription subunit 4 n=1 Tax=Orbilia blumenaviensis TaxID=1796055 RepID=A0AAV9VHR8_9PEZI